MSQKAKMCKSPKNIVYDKIEYENLNTNCTIVGSNNLHLVKKPQIVTSMSPAYSNPSPGYPPSPYSSPASLKSPSPQNIKPPTPQPNAIPVMQIIHNHPAVITRPMHTSQPQNVIKLKPPLNILPKPSASPQQSPKPSVSPQIVLPANQQTIMPTAQPLLLNQMPMLAPGVQFILRPQTAKLQGQMQQTPQGLILQSGGQQLLQLQPPRSQPMVRVLANGVGLPTTTYVTHMAPNNNIQQTSSMQSTPPKKKPNKKKKQKLDLANIMKLSGIGDDDDVQFESDASQSESEHNAHSQPATPQPQPTTPTIVQPPTQVVQPQGNVDNKNTKVGNIQISAVPQTINAAGTPLVQVLNQAYQGGTQTATAQPTSIPFNPFITPNFTINNGLMVQRSGGFKLALGEDGRLVLQHDPNLNQDLQSQVLLQSIFGLNGGLVLQPSIDQQIHSQTVQTIQQQSVQTIQQQTVQSQTIQTVQHQIVQPQTLQTFQSQIQGQLQSLLQQQNLGSQPIAIQPQNITMQPQGLQVSQALSLQSQPIHSQSQPISIQSQTQPITIHSQSQPIIQSHPQSIIHSQPQQINLNSQNQQIIQSQNQQIIQSQNQPTQSINLQQPITIQSSQPSISIHSQPIAVYSQSHSQSQPITIQSHSQSQPLTIQSNSHGQPMSIQSQPMTIHSQPMTIQSQPMTIQSQPMTIQSNSQPHQTQPMNIQQQSNLQPLINLSQGNQIFAQNGMQIQQNHQQNNPPTSQQPFTPNPGVTLSQGNIGTQPVLKVQPFQKTQPPVQTVHPIHHHNNQQQQPAPPPPTSYVVNLTPEQLEQLKRNGQLTVNGQTIFMQRTKTDEKKTSPKIKPIKKVNKIATIKEKAANNLEKTINNVVKDSVKSSLVSALQSPTKCQVTQASVQTQVSTPKTQPSAIIQPSVQQTQIQPKIQIAQPKVIVPPNVQPPVAPAEPQPNNQEVDRFLGQLIEETQPPTQPAPNNVVIHPPPPPVTPAPTQRVHTIQLTPQKQQHLKSIQLQIQTLSARMTPGDTEMQDALKLLFQEQQKILATGKLLSPDKVFYHNNQLIVNNSVVKSEVITPQTRPPAVSTVANGPAPPTVTPPVVQPPKVSVSIPSTVNEIVQNTAPVVQKTAPVVPVPPVVSTPAKPPQQRFLPLYTKAQLIEQQLNTDQNGAVKPDIQTPFRDKADACKRLIRYHCFEQPVLSQKDLNKADEIFELTAKHFIDKFGRMVDKYRFLLHKESQRQVQTSELMMLDRKVLAEEQESLVKLRQEMDEANMEMTQQPSQQPNSSDSQTEQEEYDEWACIQRELGCLPLEEKPPFTSTATLSTTTTTTSTVSTTTSTTCSQSMKRSSSADSRLETLKRFRVDKHCKKTEITNTKTPNYQSSTQSSNTNVYTTTVVHGTNYQSNEINQRSIQTIGRTIMNSNPRGMNPSQSPRNPDNLPFNSIHSYSNSLHIQNPIQRVNMHPSIHQHVVHNQQLLQRNVQHYSTQHIVQHITHTVHHTQQIQNSSVQNSVHHSSSVHSQNSYSSGNEELDNNDSIDEQVQSAIDSILNLQQNTSLDLDETVQNMLS